MSTLEARVREVECVLREMGSDDMAESNRVARSSAWPLAYYHRGMGYIRCAEMLAAALVEPKEDHYGSN